MILFCDHIIVSTHYFFLFFFCVCVCVCCALAAAGKTKHAHDARHLFSCAGTGLLMKWDLPRDGQHPLPGDAAAFGGPRFGGSGGENWVFHGGRCLYALPSRSALVGVCYDEGADTVSAVSKHGHVVVAQGVQGLRL